MENVMNVAAYITNRYLEEYKQPIDEMKLHKLMYFAQLELDIHIQVLSWYIFVPMIMQKHFGKNVH